MNRFFLTIYCLFMLLTGFTQSVETRLKEAYQKFETDSQLLYAGSSLYIIDAKTGQVVFEKNSRLGLAPASTLKTITSITAYELLGRDFRYETSLMLDQADGANFLKIIGSGDPSFGSWRWPSTNEFEVKKRFVKAIQAAGLKKIDHISIDGAEQTETIPDGWIWQDIGNYYGAGSETLNWRENQYDIFLKSGDNLGDKVIVTKTFPFVYGLKLNSMVRAAARGSGDNAYVYYPLHEKQAVIRGTIPVGENNFKISASLPSGGHQFLQTLVDTLDKLKIKTGHKPGEINQKNHTPNLRSLHTERSPSLDSIIYWFNKKSINLYGEALVKTFSVSQIGFASTDSGVAVLKRFWKEKGIDEDELNIYDGSGLSPQNRVTTHAQVEILKHASTKDWFPAFYDALPEYNKMKMKSGTIRDVKGFCGYHRSASGREYIFSFLVNNYSGRASSLVAKMYKVLDELK